MRFGEEEQSEEMLAESTDQWKRRRKRWGGFDREGMQLEEQKELKTEEEDERVQVAPKMGAGGSHPRPRQTRQSEGEEEAAEGEQQRNEEKEEIRTCETSPFARWALADYIDARRSQRKKVRRRSWRRK